ncbi:PREDICTED: interferon alpha/beta receptor 2-like [Cyprinodon variegatus]|uniref:interferon alpha/beta receptor 2-like n=1 Tax=Cyprinodon variegatus TaxID=28743 RepID=UPI0007425821|nr:PREDICTED: interferon alpha/beta receptor 2-like [Cyprinodon variegatus]
MMSEVLWFLSWLPLVLTAVSELPPPSEVRVTLDHSGYFLRWERGAGTPPGTSFCVQTQRSNNKWEPVSGCQQVQKQLTCNLTEAFREYLEIFKIQVEAQLKGQRSQPVVLKDYKPPAHLPPPEIDVTLCGSIFCVELLPPYLNPWDIYNHIRYEIQVDQQVELRTTTDNVQHVVLDSGVLMIFFFFTNFFFFHFMFL